RAGLRERPVPPRAPADAIPSRGLEPLEPSVQVRCAERTCKNRPPAKRSLAGPWSLAGGPTEEPVDRPPREEGRRAWRAAGHGVFSRSTYSLRLWQVSAR